MKNKQKILLSYLLIFLAIFLLAKASILSIITPFAIAFSISLTTTKKRGFVIALLFLLANTLTSLTLTNLIVSGIVSFLILILSFIKFNSTKSKLITSSLFLLLTHLPSAYLSLLNNQSYEIILSFVIAELFLLSCFHLINAIYKKGSPYRFTIDESLCACFFITALYLGIKSVNLVYVDLFHIISLFSVLIFSYLIKEKSIILSAVIGFSAVLYNLDTSPLALLVLSSLVCIAFKNNKRIFSTLSVIAVDIIFSLYLVNPSTYTLISAIETVVISIIFLLIKQNYLDNLILLFNDDRKNILNKDLVNRNRDTLYKKFCELSAIFSEMDNVFKKTIKGVLPLEKAKEMLAEEASNKICEGCLEKNKCLRARGKDTNKVMQEIFDAGFSRGKATLLDIPPYLTNRCSKVNALLQCVNNLILQYKQYASMVSSLDSSKVLVAEQLNGVSRIMKSLGNDVKQNISFDEAKEEAVLNELTFNNIICSEVAIYEDNINATNVNIVVRNNDCENKIIPKIVSKICNHKLTVNEIVPSKYSGWSIVSLCSAPKYDVIFGYSSKTKTSEEISGDTYSLLRLNDNRFMMALCDGMGSGENANKTSSLALSLIENFYKAGFDNDIILNSVNKLLAINNEESYTALDLAVLDLNTNFIDFIKLGAPACFIKHKTTTDIVSSSALPMGILSEMKPNITKSVLNDGDIIVLVTDGIMDSFSSTEALCNFVNNISSLNPQEISDLVLDKAISLNGGIAPDDMTVLTCRVYSKK